MKTKEPAALDPFVAAIDLIGDAWTFLITREAFFGATRFGDFARALNVSPSRLAERLKHLVALGLFQAKQYETAPPRFQYRLTSSGLGIYSIALSMIAWGQKWRSDASDIRLVHSNCGHPIEARCVCRACGTEISAADLEWPPILPLSQVILDEVNVRGWRKAPRATWLTNRKDPAAEVLKVVGDRWSMLIMYGAQQGEFRFREAQSKLGIAHNILSARLNALVSDALLERADGSKHAPYRATAAGRDLLYTILAIRTWALDHVLDDTRNWNEIIHRPCGSDIRVDLNCAQCSDAIRPLDVTVLSDPQLGTTG